jgi:enterobactin synthetase component D
MSGRPDIKIPRLFPDYVAHRGMAVWEENALPAEIPLPPRLRNAVWSRQADYVSGRLCAREALELLGAKPGDIPFGEGGSPAWPSGFVGSITHSNQQAFAAVARKSRVLSLGLDVEKIMPPGTAMQLAPFVATSGEYQNLRKISLDMQLLTTMIFSAKEAVFKCLYPVLKFRFDFTDVEILSIDAAIGSFSLVLGNVISKFMPAPAQLVGKIAVIDDLVHTGLILPFP